VRKNGILLLCNHCLRNLFLDNRAAESWFGVCCGTSSAAFLLAEMRLRQKGVILKGIVMGVIGVMLIASIPVSEILGIGCGMFVLTLGAMALGFGILKAGGEHIRL
jgi:hypothetical protein